MSFRFASAALALSLVLLSFVALPGRALAHETRTVGTYQLVVGFFVEPAFEGQKNGLDLRVRVPGTPATRLPASRRRSRSRSASSVPTSP